MRITYFRLKGYAGIFQGMGRNEIEIPFHQLRNKIVLIRGDNGCGKSTILKALSLEIDGSENYMEDVYWKPDSPNEVVRNPYPAEKEIHLQDGQDYYHILILSPVKNGKRQTTKAYISRNGEELNENGNVSSYKEIRNSLLDMDPNYINLSIVSSENRGIVDMKPAERKKYMSEMIGSLEFYNNCYKALSNKSSIYKSNIGRTKNKIFNIGDPDNLEATYQAANARLMNLEQDRRLLVEQIAECTAVSKILDPDGKINDLYSSIVVELETINNELRKNTATRDSLHSRLSKTPEMSNNDIQYSLGMYREAIEKYQETINQFKIELSGLVSTSTSIKNQLFDIEHRKNSMESPEVRSDLVKLIEDAKDKIQVYQELFDTAPIDLTKVTYSELFTIKNILFDFVCAVKDTIYDNQDTIIRMAIGIESTGNMQNISGNIESIEQEIESIQQEEQELRENIKKSEVLEKRPAECQIDSCPLLVGMVGFDRSLAEDKLRMLSGSMEMLLEVLEKSKKDLQEQNEAVRLAKRIQEVYRMVSNNYMIQKVPQITSSIKTYEAFLSSLSSHYMFHEFSDIDEYITMSQYMDDYTIQKNLLVGYEADQKVYLNYTNTMHQLDEEQRRLEEELSKVEASMEDMLTKQKQTESILSEMISNKETLDSYLEYEKAIQELTKKKEALREKFQKAKDDIAKVKSKSDEKYDLEQRMRLLDGEYAPLKASVDQMKYALTQLYSYRDDLIRYEADFDRIEFLKKCCSPTSTGIQSVFISIYMNRTIMVANDLLSSLFGGTLQLLKPNINSESFSLPFINEFGKEVSDVSLASTSQKCMFGMVIGFALLSQASDKYNIVRLDEIDGGLDFENARQFVGLLLHMLEFMSIDQCIMISHKLELDMFQCSVIHVSKEGLSFTN